MDLDTILDKNEEVLLRTKPRLIPFLFNNSYTLIFFVIFLVIFLGLALSTFFGGMTLGFTPSENINSTVLANAYSTQYIIASVRSFSTALTLLYCSFILILYVLFLISYRNYEYLLTTKRIVLSYGIIGRNFKILDFDKIQNTSVDIGLVDRIFGTGSISFFSGETENNGSVKDVFANINNPYEAFKLVKQTIVDVKSDLEFPNKFRPDTNPGYKSEYKNKD